MVATLVSDDCMDWPLVELSTLELTSKTVVFAG